MSIEASNPPTSKLPKGPESSSSDILRAEFATTNYGSQVAYNYGSISNYFCHNSDATHQCSFPKVSLPKDSPESQLYNKIERARVLYKSRRWTDAKVLFYEVLYTPYPTPAATERLLIQYNLAHTHFALGEFSEAVRHFQELVDIREERNETPEESISDSRYWLARSFYHLKRYEDASTELQVFVLTHDQQDTHRAEQATTGRLWLGLTFERLEQYEEAKEQLKIAFETRSQTLGSEHLDTLACQHHLANFLYKRKAFPEAQEQFDALLHAENRLSGPEKAEAVKTRCMLAFCLAKLERYDKAEPHLERVLARMDSYSRRTAEEVRDTGLICYWLGCIALRKDRRHSVEAGRLFQRALNCIPNATANNKNDNNDLQDELIDCRRRLAFTMYHQGQFAGAEQTFRQVIDDMDETKQDDLIASRYGLASSLIAQRKFTEAKSTLEEVPTIMSPIKNCRHTGEDLAACVHKLGMAYNGLNQYREARDCFQRVVDIVPKTPNENYSFSQRCLAMVLFELQEFESARKHFQEPYDTVTKHFPSSRQFVIVTRFWLAWSLCELGHFHEAEPHLRPTFTMFPKPEKGPIPESDFVLGRSYYYMGRIVSYQKDRKEAAKQFRIALPMLNRRFGPDDPTYLQCRYHLAYSLFQLDENSEARQIFEELLNSESQHNIVQDVRLILAPYWLGRISNLQRKPQDSEQYFAKCLNALGSKPLPLHPTISTESIQYHYALGLYRNNKMEECADIVQKILAHAHQLDLNTGSESYLLSRWLLSRCLYFTEKYDEACEHLKFTVTAYEATYGYDNLQTSLARAYLVDSLCERKRYIEADPILINVATQQGASPGTKEELVKAIGTYWLGRRAYDRAKLEEAEGHFDTARTLLAAASRDKTWNRLRFGCRHFLARIKLKNKQHAEAENLFRELARQQYESGHINYAVDNQYYLGFSLRLQRKYDSARSVLQKILDDNKEGRFIDNGVPLCHYQVGHCLYRVNKIKEAKSQLEIALECPHQFSEKFQARLLLGQSNYQLSLFEESRADFQSLLKEGHKDSESIFLCRFWLGKTHFELKNWDDASTHLLIAHESSKKGWSNVLDSQYFLAELSSRLRIIRQLWAISNQFATHKRTMCQV
jgi:tetratricopeptide (TPR) repeat protein